MASVLGCSTVTPPSPPASATPDGDLPPATVLPQPIDPLDPAAPSEPGDGAGDGRRGPAARPAVPAAPELPGAYRFVSAPDFLNQDVADLTAPGVRARGTSHRVNSTNDEYDAALDHVIGEMASQEVEDVLVAGDLVEGRWGRDDSGSGVFGPVRTPAQRMRAWRRAADVYYPAYRERFADHGLRTLPAVGDHEVGDDPWRAPRGGSRSEWIDFKREHVPQFKRLFADHMLTRPDGRARFTDRPRSGPARRTAYAVRLDEDVLVVTLDVFERRGGDVHMSVDPAQLRWLRQVLRQARQDGVAWVMVQGHTPMTSRVRARNSSHLVYEKGARSDLWRTMVRGGVDVYLSGEVHDQTVRQRDGILEVSHGSLFYRGEASYVLGQADADRLVLENHQFRGEIGFDERLWTTSRQGAPAHISYPDPSVVTGTLVASRTSSGGLRVEESAGVLRPRD